MPYISIKRQLETLNSRDLLHEKFPAIAREMSIAMPILTERSRFDLLQTLMRLTPYFPTDEGLKVQFSQLFHQIMVTPFRETWVVEDGSWDPIPVFVTNINLLQPLSEEDEAHLYQQLETATFMRGFFFSHGQLFKVQDAIAHDTYKPLFELQTCQNIFYPVEALQEDIIPDDIALPTERASLCIYPNLKTNEFALSSMIACLNCELLGGDSPHYGVYPLSVTNSEAPWELMVLNYAAPKRELSAWDSMHQLQAAGLLTGSHFNEFVAAIHVCFKEPTARSSSYESHHWCIYHEFTSVYPLHRRALPIYYAIEMLSKAQKLTLDMWEMFMGITRTGHVKKDHVDWVYYRLLRAPEGPMTRLQHEFDDFLALDKNTRAAITLFLRVFISLTADDIHRIKALIVNCRDFEALRDCHFSAYKYGDSRERGIISLQILLRMGLLDQENSQTILALSQEEIFVLLYRDLPLLREYPALDLTKPQFNLLLTRACPGKRMLALCKVQSWKLPIRCQRLVTEHDSPELLMAVAQTCPPLTEPQLYELCRQPTLFISEKAGALKSLHYSDLLHRDNVKKIFQSQSKPWLQSIVDLCYYTGCNTTITQDIFDLSEQAPHAVRALCSLHQHDLLTPEHQTIMMEGASEAFLKAVSEYGYYLTPDLIQRLKQCSNYHEERMRAWACLSYNCHFTAAERAPYKELLFTTPSLPLLETVRKFHDKRKATLHTPAILQNLVKHSSPLFCYRVLDILHRKKLLSTHGDFIMHQLPEASLRAIAMFCYRDERLHEWYMYMDEFRLNIASAPRLRRWLRHGDISMLLGALGSLPDALLTKINIDSIEKLAYPRVITVFMEAPQDVKTQSYLDKLLFNVEILATQDIQDAYSQIPFQRKTPAFYTQLFQACDRQRHHPLNRSQAAIGDFLARQIVRDPVGRRVLNHSQSTHTATIHRSASESACALMKTYQGAIKKQGDLDKLFTSIHLDTEDEAIQPFCAHAQEAFTHIVYKAYGHYRDPVSGVGVNTLLALVLLAIHDEARRMGSFDDAKKALIIGLQEIAYGDEGCFICQSGAFNKLIELMAGRHPDIKYIFVTPTSIALKYQAVLEASVRHYITTQLDAITTKKDLKKFEQSRHELEEGNMPPYIWLVVKPHVEKTLWAAFTEGVHPEAMVAFTQLYPSQTSPSYRSFIESGKNDLDYPALIRAENFQRALIEKKEKFANKRDRSLEKNTKKTMLLGGLAIGTLSFGLAAGIMVAVGSALPFITFLGPVAAILLSASLIATISVVIFEAIVMIIRCCSHDPAANEKLSLRLPGLSKSLSVLTTSQDPTSEARSANRREVQFTPPPLQTRLVTEAQKQAEATGQPAQGEERGYGF